MCEHFKSAFELSRLLLIYQVSQVCLFKLIVGLASVAPPP